MVISPASKPVELIAQTNPSTIAEDEIVVMTVPVFFSAPPQHEGQIRLLLTLPHAEYLYGQIDSAIKQARRNARKHR
jgi:hypothetical protein